MKLKRLKVLHSIRIGNTETTYLQVSDFQMQLIDSLIIRVRCNRTNDVVYTPVTNAAWFCREEEDGSTGAKSSP